jgi:hypothetical protein
MDDQVASLLGEIRDLLKPIAHHYQPEYDKYQLSQRAKQAEDMRKLVKSGKSLDSCLLMDGTRTRLEIREATSIDSGNLSRLMGSLGNAGLIASEDDGKPCLIFSTSEIRTLYGLQ